MVVLSGEFNNDSDDFDEAGVDDIYRDHCFDKAVYFMCPGSRWPIGTDLALPGPLYTTHYFDGADSSVLLANEYRYAPPWRHL